MNDPLVPDPVTVVPEATKPPLATTQVEALQVPAEVVETTDTMTDGVAAHVEAVQKDAVTKKDVLRALGVFESNGTLDLLVKQAASQDIALAQNAATLLADADVRKAYGDVVTNMLGRQSFGSFGALAKYAGAFEYKPTFKAGDVERCFARRLSSIDEEVDPRHGFGTSGRVSDLEQFEEAANAVKTNFGITLDGKDIAVQSSLRQAFDRMHKRKDSVGLRRLINIMSAQGLKFNDTDGAIDLGTIRDLPADWASNKSRSDVAAVLLDVFESLLKEDGSELVLSRFANAISAGGMRLVITKAMR